MIEKKPVRGSNKMSVTFRPQGLEKARSVHVLGDFNEWSTDRHAMRKRRDGTWSLTLRLPRRKQFQFRYLVDGQHWETDPESDGVQPNDYGSTNALVRT